MPAVVLIAVASTFLGLFIAIAVSEVFEAQTFSNFFRFPMIFLCGLFGSRDAVKKRLQKVIYDRWLNITPIPTNNDVAPLSTIQVYS